MAEQIRGKEMAEQIAILYLAFHGLYLVIYQTLYFKVAQKKKKKVTKQLSSTGFHYETGQTLIDN